MYFFHLLTYSSLHPFIQATGHITHYTDCKCPAQSSDAIRTEMLHPSDK